MTSVASAHFMAQCAAAGADFAVEKQNLLKRLPAFLEQRFGIGGKPEPYRDQEIRSVSR